MADRVLVPSDSRVDAVVTLLSRLEDLGVTYAAGPVEERRSRLDADAERITGEVARCLQVARTQITPVRHHAG